MVTIYNTFLFEVAGSLDLLDFPGTEWLDGAGDPTIVAGIGSHRLYPLGPTGVTC